MNMKNIRIRYVFEHKKTKEIKFFYFDIEEIEDFSLNNNGTRRELEDMFGCEINKHSIESLNDFIMFLNKLEYKLISKDIKDNEKVLYVNDIVQIVDNYHMYGSLAGNTYKVSLYNGAFRLAPKYDKNIIGMVLDDNNDFNVIGNIHENIELLNIKNEWKPIP